MLASLNEAQRQAVTAIGPQVVVVAGAGSGKTRVLVARIQWLIRDQGVDPYRILAVTFTNKAASEMQHRISTVLGPEASSIWVGTFHGIAHRMLRIHAAEVGLPSDFQIIDGDDQRRLVKRLLRDNHLEDAGIDPKQIIGFISRQKDDGLRAGQVTQVAAHQRIWVELYRQYEAFCARMGLVDFGELLLRLYDLLEKSPTVLAQYQARFAQVLVDEFQDTNIIQYRILKKLCTIAHGLMVVGDDDQSIYGWRGAKIENIHRFSKDYPATQMIRLEQNYRSTPVILGAANALIARNQKRLGKALWTDQTVQGERIGIHAAFSELDEALFIVDQLQHWHRKGRLYFDSAILYRSNAQSRVLEQVLRQAQIPYRIYGGMRFFERAEVRDILAYLRLVMYRADDPAFERIINVPPRGIGDKTFDSIRDRAKKDNCSLWDAARAQMGESTTRVRQSLQAFIAFIESFDIAKMTLPDIVEKLLSNQDLITYYQNQAGEKSQTRVDNLAELMTAVKQFQETYIGSEHPAQAFLSEVALNVGEEAQDAAQTDYVKLMTLHAAKGLEFPLVFVTGLEEGLFPNHRCLANPDDLEEERRLCYVGITRAMEVLFFTYALRRAFSGGQSASRPSRFLDEIPPQFLENLSHRHAVSMPASVTIAPKVSNQTGPYPPGQRVRHARFGDGVVLDRDGDKEQMRVKINFERIGEKWLVLAYAKLEVISRN